MTFYFAYVTFIIFAVVVAVSILRIARAHVLRKRQIVRNGGLPVHRPSIAAEGRYGPSNDLPWVHSPSRGGVSGMVYGAMPTRFESGRAATAPVTRVDGGDRDGSLPQYVPSVAYPPNVYAPTEPSYTPSDPHLAAAHRAQIELYEQAQAQARIQALADAQANEQVGDVGSRRLGVDDMDAVDATSLREMAPPEYGKEPPKYA